MVDILFWYIENLTASSINFGGKKVMASYLQNMFLLGMHKENRTKMLHLTVSCEPEDLSHCFTVLVVDWFFFFSVF